MISVCNVQRGTWNSFCRNAGTRRAGPMGAHKNIHVLRLHSVRRTLTVTRVRIEAFKAFPGTLLQRGRKKNVKMASQNTDGSVTDQRRGAEQVAGGGSWRMLWWYVETEGYHRVQWNQGTKSMGALWASAHSSSLNDFSAATEAAAGVKFRMNTHTYHDDM